MTPVKPSNCSVNQLQSQKNKQQSRGKWLISNWRQRIISSVSSDSISCPHLAEVKVGLSQQSGALSSNQQHYWPLSLFLQCFRTSMSWFSLASGSWWPSWSDTGSAAWGSTYSWLPSACSGASSCRASGTWMMAKSKSTSLSTNVVSASVGFPWLTFMQ